MSVLIKGIDIPKKHHMNCYYIDDGGKVFDVSRKNVIGKAVQIPSEQSEPHWIPCSERLPELDDEVLVTDDGGGLRHCIFCTWGETWCGFTTYEEGMRIIATAWMPLPPAYKGGE